ncbi:MAG: HEAT repeat domain-containing protein [Planctomycetota bacterium]
MSDIRDELCRFVRLFQHRQGVLFDVVLERLERFGDALIPGLIECLKDDHPDVRYLAVQLLAAARPRSDVAVPDLIERLSDEDWTVVTSVMFHIGDFGPMAAGAIPHVEPWLGSPNNYLQVLAATTIVKLDPSRTELLPKIWDATTGDHPVARDTAREFFDEP